MKTSFLKIPKLYTDASLKKHIGIGGYSNRLYFSYMVDGKKDVNRAELCAIYAGLLLTPEEECIDVYSDSSTALSLIEKQLYNKKYELIVNCIQYVSFVKFSSVRFNKVKGHSGVYGNEMADRLAKRGADCGKIFYSPNVGKYKEIEDVVLENIYKNSRIHDITFSS